MIQIISDNKHVKIRKAHRCFACNRTFEPGTIMLRGVYKYDDIYSLYTCDACNELMTKFKDYFYDDMEDFFPEFCILEVLKNDQTPEQLLEQLKNKL